MSKYENGFSDCTIVVDEIIQYLRFRESGSTITPTIRLNGSNIILCIMKDDTVFLEKLIHIVINKADMVLDTDIRGEYIHAFHSFLKTYFADTCGGVIDDACLQYNTHVVSAWTHE